MAVKLQERDGTHFVVDVLVSASGAQAQVAVGVHDLHSAAGSGGRGNAQAKNNGWDREGSDQPDCSSAHGCTYGSEPNTWA
jgi:hypothetical protein